MQVAYRYFENGVAYFMGRINECTSTSEDLLLASLSFGAGSNRWASASTGTAATSSLIFHFVAVSSTMRFSRSSATR
jgi:hypothetical protein